MTDPDKTAHALDLLDARGRQAAASLHTAVDDLLVDAPPVPLDSVVVDLRRSEKRRRRGWLIAAAILTVAGVTTAVLLRQTRDQEGTVAGNNPTYLVPRSVPNGWQIQEARVIRASDFPSVLDVSVAVYGDPTLDDPWTGPQLSVLESAGVLTDEGEDEGEPIDVAGQRAFIDDSDGTVSLRMTTDDGSVDIGGAAGIDRDAVVAAAEGYLAGDVDGALPDGIELLARGPGSAITPFGNFAFDGMTLLYGGASSDEGQLVVVQRAGDADDAELLRASPETTVTEVHGQTAYAMDGTLQWYEPSIGVLVTVLSYEGGVDDAELLAFAESLEPGRPGEVADIVKAYSASGPAGRLEPGEVVVVEGEPDDDGRPAWQVVASDDGSEGFGLTFANSGGSTGMGFSGAWDTLSINVADHAEAAVGDQIGVFGLVTPEAAEVTIEAPGRGPLRFELHRVEGIEGWEDLVFAGLVPLDLGSAEVVARAADGTELERLSWSPDEGSTGSGSSGSAGATIEESTDAGSVSDSGSGSSDGMVEGESESESDSAEASSSDGG